MIHPSEDELETYLLTRARGRRGEAPNDAAAIAAIEEHLLFCGPCLDWVQAQEHAVRIMRECLRWSVPKRTRRVEMKAMTANQGWLFDQN